MLASRTPRPFHSKGRAVIFLAGVEKERGAKMCGIVGFSGTEDAAMLAAVGLHHLQHRGQEGAGIVSWDGTRLYEHRAAGLVGHIYTRDTLQKLPGRAAIGQVLYATSEDDKERQQQVVQKRVQPFTEYFSFGSLVITHNGNLTNAKTLYRKLLANGRRLKTDGIDTEVALQLIGSTPGTNIVERLERALPQLEGAYSFIMLAQGKLIGVRDPMGIRPLLIGRIGDAFAFASETCALEALDASGICEVEPGEIVVIENGELTSHVFAHETPRPCIFEYIYFSRPDSIFGDKSVDEMRVALGRELAREAPVTADLIVPIPASGVSAGEGYAAELGIPFTTQGIIRNHYNWRSFIERLHIDREQQVILKHSPNRTRLKGMRIGLVDDSLIRAITAQRVVQRVFHAGAREVHLRISCPPWLHGCHLGISEKNPLERLGAPGMNVEQACEEVKCRTGATSVAYLSIDGMHRAIYGAPRDRARLRACDSCFTGDCPVRLTDLCTLH